jgi:4-amino-4-deoxy-L-arabinose transferase-like glycosyltransferase
MSDRPPGSGRARASLAAHRWELLFVSGATLLLYLRFLDGPMRLWDEASYATIAHYASAHGYWLVPHIPYDTYVEPTTGVQPYLRKPPLGFWLQAASMSVFGRTVVAARLPAVVASGATAAVVYGLGTHLYSRRVGLLAGTIFVAIPQFMLGSHGGRTATFDAPLVFFGIAFLAALYVGATERRRRLLLVAGCCFGAAMLTKGFAAGIFAIVALPFAVAHREVLLSRWGAGMCLIAVAVPAPWLALASLRHPDLLTVFVHNQVLDRVSGDLGTAAATFGFMSYPYLREFPELYSPWTYPFLPALVGVPVVEGVRRTATRWRTWFVVWWAVAVFGFFAWTGNHGWYIQPMAPAVALLCALVIQRAMDDRAHRALLGVGALGVVLFSDTGAKAVELLTAVGLPAVAATGAVLGAAVLGVAVAPRVDAMAAAVERIDGRRALSVALAATVLIQAGALLAVAGPYDGQAARQQMETGRTIQADGVDAAPLVVQEGIKAPLSNLVFFADRPTRGATVAELNRQSSARYAVIRASDRPDLRRGHTVAGRLTSKHYPALLVVRFDERAGDGSS